MNMKSHQNETSSPGFWTENINPPSTLRDRLRNQDVAVPASPKPPTYDHVYQQFRASFGADLEPTRRNDPGPSAAENRDADAVTQLRESFALAGMNLHASATAQLVEAHSKIQSRVHHFVSESVDTLSQNKTLYSNITFPLSATLCHSDNFPRASILDHLANLKREVLSAKEELRRLGAEWDACAQAEQDAWKQLTGETSRGTTTADGDDTKMAKRFKADAEKIVKEKCQLLGDIEKEFKTKIQAETLRLMQTMIDE